MLFVCFAYTLLSFKEFNIFFSGGVVNPNQNDKVVEEEKEVG